jgi:hypothetical protein
MRAVSREEGSSVRRAAAIAVLVALAALAPVAGSAQQATPPPGAEAPGPEECRVPVRSPEEIMAVLASPAAEPGTGATGVPAPGEQRAVASEDEFPTGEPADAAAAAPVEAVVREFTACFNARDLFRLFSLVSNDFLRGLASETGVPAAEDELATAAAMQPTPVSEGDRQLILAIRDARVFPDGRVGVVLVGDWLNDEQDPNPSLVVLVQTGEGWLIDAVITVDPEAAGS